MNSELCICFNFAFGLRLIVFHRSEQTIDLTTILVDQQPKLRDLLLRLGLLVFMTNL